MRASILKKWGLQNVEFETSQMVHPALIFILENLCQVQQKAKKFDVDIDDAIQEALLTYLEKIDSVDQRKGSAKKLIFGRLENKFFRMKFGALRFSLQIDENTENIPTVESRQEFHVWKADFPSESAPGAHKLLEIANEISGKSALEMAREFGISKRQMNNRLRVIKEQASVQFSFNLNNFGDKNG